MRSLGVAILLLLSSPLLIALSGLLYRKAEPSTGAGAFLLAATPLLLGLILVISGFSHLIRDVDRGYSPQRCSLAAVLLLAALAVLSIPVLGAYAMK